MNERTVVLNRLKAVLLLVVVSEGSWATDQWREFCRLAVGIELNPQEATANPFLKKALNTAMLQLRERLAYDVSQGGEEIKLMMDVVSVEEMREFFISDLTNVIEAANRLLGGAK